ncbi:hypothetical protein CLAIMM_14452 [Cladophialophora immunda]|nr:hypothetical protein CLAIMM_14452 [Cladophialophora immunda]
MSIPYRPVGARRPLAELYSSGDDLPVSSRARNPGDVLMGGLDADGDDRNNTSPVWEGAAPPTSSPEGENSDDQGYEWFRHQLYFAQQARLINFDNAAAGPSSLPANPSGMDDDDDADAGDSDPDDSDEDWFYNDDNDDELDAEDDDDEEEQVGQEAENPPEITPLPPRATGRRRRRRQVRNRRQIAHAHDGGAPMLALALSNWRVKRDGMIADKVRADKVEQEERLENRVLALSAAVKMGLPLRKDENKQLFNGDEAVLRDKFDYRKLATAGARRARTRAAEGGVKKE